MTATWPPDPFMYMPVVSMGWTCPKCGGCYAPTVTECHRCAPTAVVTSQFIGPATMGGIPFGRPLGGS